MLLSFGFQNFLSFREGAVISLELDAQARKVINSSIPYTTALCIKGANASGKTHALKAISFLAYFVSNSFKDDPDDPISIFPHFDSSDPIDFFVEFISGEDKYRYELSVTDSEILSEKIYRTRARRTLLLERKKNKISKCVKEWERINSVQLRKNASIASTSRQYGFDEVAPILSFFEGIISNVTFAGLKTNPLDEYEASSFMKENEEIAKFVQNFISECDVGVTKISIGQRIEPGGKKIYFPAFHHGEDVERVITWHTESSGTRALYKELIRYKLVLDLGGVLIADEFDIHLHPHILPKVLNLFLDPKINKKSAQIIFTTHNSAILDFMGKYRTYFVEKEDNESFVYRLDEIVGDILRNDRPISPLYREGRLGGVPKL